MIVCWHCVKPGYRHADCSSRQQFMLQLLYPLFCPMHRCTLPRKVSPSTITITSTALHVRGPPALHRSHRHLNDLETNTAREFEKHQFQISALPPGRICSLTVERLHTCALPCALPGLLLRLRSTVWSGIFGGAICAPRTVSPTLVVEP